jgi:hypothetical protein
MRNLHISTSWGVFSKLLNLNLHFNEDRDHECSQMPACISCCSLRENCEKMVTNIPSGNLHKTFSTFFFRLSSAFLNLFGLHKLVQVKKFCAGFLIVLTGGCYAKPKRQRPSPRRLTSVAILLILGVRSFAVSGGERLL